MVYDAGYVTERRLLNNDVCAPPQIRGVKRQFLWWNRNRLLVSSAIGLAPLCRHYVDVSNQYHFNQETDIRLVGRKLYNKVMEPVSATPPHPYFALSCISLDMIFPSSNRRTHPIGTTTWQRTEVVDRTRGGYSGDMCILPRSRGWLKRRSDTCGIRMLQLCHHRRVPSHTRLVVKGLHIAHSTVIIQPNGQCGHYMDNGNYF